ncbi:allophanate hydrolase subunit 1 [Egicoccus sp. AB-alg6-2]|uniref:5-oxoprolinase subunit B family protein n=1 Tax=Egicoccus sp. AB-alg6-2 TaxID=3242692 RepID=UPI00359D50A5
MRLLPCGDAGVLVEVDDLDAALTLQAGLVAAAVPGVVDVVPALRTVLVRIDPGRTSIAAVAETVGALPRGADHRPDVGTLEIPVRYDGADLDEVGAVTGLGRAGVVEAHTGQTWTVAFTGFAPGFGYLLGEDDRLTVPRRRDPRTRVPQGAVGLADGFSGVYPRPSPGGWQLIGSTARPMWDLQRDPPALLRPGVRVRFVAVS